MTSDDEGESWSEMQELPWELTGDRHIARYAPDGRMVVTFRDTARGSSTYGDFVAWVGSYEDIEAGRPGQYRVRLLKNHGRPGDTGYAGHGGPPGRDDGVHDLLRPRTGAAAPGRQRALHDGGHRRGCGIVGGGAYESAGMWL